MKGELEDDPNNPEQRKNRTRFLEQTGADYVRFVRQELPINPLYRDQNPAVNAQIANEIASLIRCFAPQLGANQQQAISDSYQNLVTPDFTSLLLELQQNGVTGVPVAIISRIVGYNLFAAAQTAISPEQWLRRSLVIDFKEFGNDSETKALAAALILNFLIKKLSQQLLVKNDIQPLKMVLFVDEAHLLLPKRIKPAYSVRLRGRAGHGAFPSGSRRRTSTSFSRKARMKPASLNSPIAASTSRHRR